MPQRVQSLRSSVTQSRPAAGTRQPVEIYVNFSDLQLGVVNAAQTAQDLIGGRYFSTNANYSIGDFVYYNGQLYRAKVAITAGAFTAANWDQVQLASMVSTNFLPLTGGSLAGPGNLTVGGTLGVTGIATFTGMLTANGNAQINNTLGVYASIVSGSAVGSFRASYIEASGAHLINLHYNGSQWVYNGTGTAGY